MNGVECNTTLKVTIEGHRRGEMVELVRGQENALLEQVRPLAHEQSVMLDMRHVERIDAAGIAALITLYRSAHDAGHEFTICHALPRVEEILNLVGVKHLLIIEREECGPEHSLALELVGV